jgi:hypothetical protein
MVLTRLAVGQAFDTAGWKVISCNLWISWLNQPYEVTPNTTFHAIFPAPNVTLSTATPPPPTSIIDGLHGMFDLRERSLLQDPVCITSV